MRARTLETRATSPCLRDIAAGIAWRAIHIQRDTAKRRAAIDFFLKMETEDGLIGAYDAFRALAPQIVAIASRLT